MNNRATNDHELGAGPSEGCRSPRRHKLLPSLPGLSSLRVLFAEEGNGGAHSLAGTPRSIWKVLEDLYSSLAAMPAIHQGAVPLTVAEHAAVPSLPLGRCPQEIYCSSRSAGPRCFRLCRSGL